MGHRDSSQEFGEQGGVCGADGRSDAPAEETVNIFPSLQNRPGKTGLIDARDRRRSTSSGAEAPFLSDLNVEAKAPTPAASICDMASGGDRRASKEIGQGAKVEVPGAKGDDGVPGRAPEYSWGVRAALFALSFYKTYLSSVMAGNCRFQPTCSRYAYEAIERFGVARGAWLAVKRLCRCHPLSRKFGYDPVPEREQQMPRKSAGCENCGAHL
jgi:uncharacterized protein